MAAIIKHGTLGFSYFIKNNIHPRSTIPMIRHDVVRYDSNKSKQRKRENKLKNRPNYKSKWQWDGQSLATRGFLRPLKSYQPDDDVCERLDYLCKLAGISNDDSTVLEDLNQRFKFFTECQKEFDHSIPNSTLHAIETIGDLREFYKSPVNTTLPIDEMMKMELPKNLHIQADYVRFHPDNDTKFKGKTAFPRSSTLVTGLTYKKKYPSLIQKHPYAIN